MIAHRLTASLLVLLLLTPLVALGANDVQFSSSAEVEVKQVNAKGETVTVRKPADKVPPGEIVIIVNVFTNTGKVAKEKLVVTNPVPKETEYVGNSASVENAEVLFSIDGGQRYAKPTELLINDGKGGKRVAEPKEYTHIRWTMKNPLKPGSTGLVEFRVRVK